MTLRAAFHDRKREGSALKNGTAKENFLEKKEKGIEEGIEESFT